MVETVGAEVGDSIGSGIVTELGSSKGTKEGKLDVQLRGFSEVSENIAPGVGYSWIQDHY